MIDDLAGINIGQCFAGQAAAFFFLVDPGGQSHGLAAEAADGIGAGEFGDLPGFSPPYVPGFVLFLAVWAVFLTSTWTLAGVRGLVLCMTRLQITPEERALAWG
jgi:hypothetical protein